MTEVSFHFNAPDKLGYACRLLRKAWGRRAAVTVLAPAPRLAELDRLLWTFSAHDFVPHCLADAPAAVLQATPIVLAVSLAQAQALPMPPVLLNLDDEVPADFDRCTRLLEVVSTDPQDRHLARTRWRHYAQLGCDMTQHDFVRDATSVPNSR